MKPETKCEECGKEFDSPKDLEVHLDLDHDGNHLAEMDKLPTEQAQGEDDSDDDEIITDVEQQNVNDQSETRANSDSGSTDRPEPSARDSSEEASSAQYSDTSTTGANGSIKEGSEKGVSLNGYLDKADEAQAKWFLFGVGGCGGNLIDSVILRSETIRNNEQGLRNLWPRALRGLASVNSNNTEELYQTHYVQEYRDDDPETVSALNSVGPPSIPGGGAVYAAGEELAEWVFEQDKKDFAGDKWGKAASHRRISDAQAVIFFHSSVKGTGSGATPVIANALDEALSPDEDWDLDLVDPTATKFSISVLPSSGCGGLERSNGLVGFARLIKTMDAVIPVDNENLVNARAANESISVKIDGTEGYQLHKHRKANETLVSFLETFTFASIAGGEDATIQGDGFDPTDAYRPARFLYTDSESQDKTTPAVVMAPAYGTIKTGRNKFNETALNNLVINTLTEGKLIDFDHTTAWGGSFVIEAPTDHSDHIKTVCDQHFQDTIKTPEILNIDSDGAEEGQMFPTRRYDIYRDDIDTVRMWALIYNPEMKRLNKWRDWAESHRDGPEEYQVQLRNRWDEIEDLFTLLGRKNRGSSQKTHE